MPRPSPATSPQHGAALCVARDLSGNFSAGTITADLAGNAATATTATNLSGNVADAQLSSNVPLINGANPFTGSNNFAGVVIATNANNLIAGTVVGDGGGLTNLNASQLPVATTSTLGVVQPDGSTITINHGVISASGGAEALPPLISPTPCPTACL